jgi:peptide/nickel transport system substrate-binding protein
MKQGRSAVKLAQQKKAYSKVQDMLAKQLPLLYLFYPDSFNVMVKKLHAPHTGYAFAVDHISDWYVTK